MLIFGLTGTHSSGKGEVGKYFVSKGFRYYSCSDELRKEAKRLGLEETRENLGIVIGDRLRIEFGKGVLGKRIYDQILKDKIELAVVDSLRLIEEVNELRKDLRDVVYSLKNNEYSKIAESPVGYHIFKVELIKPEKIRDFEEVQDDIYKKLYREETSRLKKQYINSLKQNVFIKVIN